jgi:lipopolysaccharide transport system ATP-binding protein
MKPIITVNNLSKRFHITPGRSQVRYHTLRDSLVEKFGSLMRTRANGESGVETVWALKNVTFDVMPGEVVGIIGPNGAGKSTLLSILSRIIEPTSGRVELYGRVASLLEIGTGFHPDLTGRENVYLNGAVLGMKRREIDAKFDEIVAFSGVAKFIDTAVKHYSSGMYVRLAFAITAHLDPEILIVDEVLAVGDANFQKKCLDKMNQVSTSGRTVLFVTHDLGKVTQFCRNAFLLKDGQIARAGQAAEVVDFYQSMADKEAAAPVAGAQTPEFTDLSASS